MGVSGAGKINLSDVLASRTTMGIISGEMLVDEKDRDESFQRKTGYAQQQDLHLSTATVREALTFSALLRQPAHIPREEKISYVADVIKLLKMSEYADAVVSVPGEGLNVEQRKRLTIYWRDEEIMVPAKMMRTALIEYERSTEELYTYS